MVDSGNLLFEKSYKKSTHKNAQKELDLKTAAALAGAHGVMGIDALNVTAEDMVAGEAFFRQDKIADLPWLSANIVDQNGKAVFPASKIIERAGLRIGIIGFTGMPKSNTTLSFPNEKAGQGTADDQQAVDASSLHCVDWVKPVGIVMAKLAEEQCDVIIALSSLDKKGETEFLTRFPEVRILIRSGNDSLNVDPIQFNNTLICQLVNRGRFVGSLEMDIHPDGKWQNLELNKQRALLNKRIRGVRLQLDKFSKQNEKQPSDQLDQKIRRLNNYLKSLEQQADEQLRKKEIASAKSIEDTFTHCQLPVKPVGYYQSIAPFVEELRK